MFWRKSKRCGFERRDDGRREGDVIREHNAKEREKVNVVVERDTNADVRDIFFDLISLTKMRRLTVCQDLMCIVRLSALQRGIRDLFT